MPFAPVIGRATALLRHESLHGQTLLLVQPHGLEVRCLATNEADARVLPYDENRLMRLGVVLGPAPLQEECKQVAPLTLASNLTPQISSLKPQVVFDEFNAAVGEWIAFSEVANLAILDTLELDGEWE